MSTWTLNGDTARAHICISSGSLAPVEILGRGRLEVSMAELREKGASDSCLYAIQAASSEDIDWCIMSTIEPIRDWIKDSHAMGYDRAEAALEVMDTFRGQGAGLLILGDHPYALLALSSPEFERVYRLFESVIVGNGGKCFQFSFVGELDVGIDQIQDHRPTPAQIASGGALLSKWFKIWVRSGTSRDFAA